MARTIRWPRLQIRTRLVLLVVAALAPFLVYTGVRTRANLAERRALAIERSQTIAREVAERLDDRLAEITTMLHATAPLVRADPREMVANDRLLRRVMEGFPSNLVNFGVFDTAGHNLGVSLVPVGVRSRYTAAGRRYLRDAIARRGLALGDVIRSSLDPSRYGTALATALFAPDSSVNGILVASFRLAWLEPLVAGTIRTPDAVVTIIDHRGTLIGRVPATQRTLGSDISSHPLVQAALAVDSLSSEMSGLDDTVRLYQSAHVDRAPWIVIVGMPVARVYAPAKSLLWRELALFASTLVLALVLALMIGRRIARPVRSLADDVAAVAGGDLSHRSTVRSTSELGGLAERFNDMAATLERNRDDLRAGQERWRALFEQSPVPMWITEVGSLRFLAVNGATVKQYGWSAEEFMHMTLRDVRPREEYPAFDASIASAPTPGVYRAQWRHWRKDGAPLEIDVTVRDVQFDGRLARLSVNVDVSPRLAAERALEDSREQLRQAQKMEAIGRFAGGIAHDFNNLLTAILGYCDLVLEDMDELAKSRGEITEIRRAAERAALLTKQILAFSRRQVLQPVQLSLNEVVGGMSGMLARVIGEHVRVAIEPAPGLWMVTADPTQVEQVVMNLALNARDAMKDGGTLTFTTRNISWQEPSGEHEGVPAGEWVCLTVSDTGHGMDAAVRARLFEPFFTTKARGQGTGLGLATAHGIVEQSNGRLRVWSEPGRGAHFHVYLPRSRGDVAAPVYDLPAAQGPGSGVILLAEDERSVRLVASDTLTRLGYTVLAASDGPSALDIARRYEGPIDLLLTDVVMPGMNGADLATRLRENRPSLRVLYASGYTDDTIVRQGVLLEGLAFIGKPFSPAQLAQRVREILGTRN